MTPRITCIAALAMAVLVALTCVHAASRRGAVSEPRGAREDAYTRETAQTASDRCALAHARFGGQRAQLIRIMRGAVPNYVVVEIGKRDPSMRSLRAAWLKANYGDAEHVWLGEYASAEAAMTRAARLCPAERRCWPGEADCGPQAESPTAAQVFFGSWPPPAAPGI